MTAKQFREMSISQIDDYKGRCALKGDTSATAEIYGLEKFLDKPVKVVKGRKVPIGTVGTVFWVGACNYSKYQNWWSWEVRVGFKDENGVVYFTSENNLEVLSFI